MLPSQTQRTRRPTANEQCQLTPTLTEDIPSPSRFHDVRKECTALAFLGIFSFFGLLARLGLTAITSYDGQVVFPVLWAQMVGCALMGAIASRKEIVEGLPLPLYTGLATGLCGSITSFSTWMLDVFQGFANIDGGSHGGFYNFMDGLSQSVITLAASVAAFVLGTHLADLLVHLDFPGRMAGHGGGVEKASHPMEGKNVKSTVNGTPSDPPKATKSPMTTVALPFQVAVILLFLLLWLVTILVCYYVPRWRGIVMFALIFSPFGVWTRFYLARLNPRLARFQLGTFAANTLGTIILATCVALQRANALNDNKLQCQVLQGIADGFCGCLTTVSTFVVELRKLDRKASYRYVLVSWTAGQLIMLVILGSVDFARGGLAARCGL